MQKIAFFDIDGTILDHEKKIPESAKRGINQLKENGIEVAIATGRPPHMITEVAEELGITTAITCNGSYVIYNGEAVFKNPIESKCVDEIIKFGLKRNHSLSLSNEHERGLTNVNEHVKKVFGESFGKFGLEIFGEDTNFHFENEVYHMLTFHEGNSVDLYVETFPDARFVPCHENVFDVIPKGGSKALGIQKLIEHLGLKIENTFGFGDGLNDIEMLQAVGTSVAMGNAVDEVKSHANYVTDDVADDGLYNALKHLELI